LVRGEDEDSGVYSGPSPWRGEGWERAAERVHRNLGRIVNFQTGGEK